MRENSAFGFSTADMMVATIFIGKRAGVHCGRVAIRFQEFQRDGIRRRRLGPFPSSHTPDPAADGYSYSTMPNKAVPPRPEGRSPRERIDDEETY